MSRPVLFFLSSYMTKNNNKTFFLGQINIVRFHHNKTFEFEWHKIEAIFLGHDSILPFNNQTNNFIIKNISNTYATI
jgi:hypothetical protein